MSGVKCADVWNLWRIADCEGIRADHTFEITLCAQAGLTRLYALSMTLFAQVPLDWQLPLQNVRSNIDQIESVIREQRSGGLQVIPDDSNLFRALSISPKQVRVVIVGQDPYPNPANACGLSFSVPSGTNPMPPTLRNILKELQADVGSAQVQDGDLTPWLKQGVMLLNRVLTTVAHKSDAHRKIGWQTITERILEVTVQNNPDVVAVLWGNPALEVEHIFKPQNVISSSHPSPLSSYRGFTGSRPFTQVNEILRERGQGPISW
jgi:uracil-DNA glycosylase